MPRPRIAMTLAARAGTFGVSEELVGDVLEEMDRGRSHPWLWQQLVGLCWFGIVSRLRNPGRPRPVAIALAMSAMLLLAGSIAPPRVVIAAWLIFYYVMGAASLFTQMATYTIGVDVSPTSETPPSEI